MSLPELFIRRPVATLLLALGLFIAGAAAFFLLPVAPLPHVDFPTISISARLPGADPETMAATVAAPLERRLGEIPGVNELTSTSSQGTTSIVAQFDIDRNIDGAAHDVQAAINASGADLPVDLPNPPTYRKSNPSDAPILILAVTSNVISAGALYDACDSILAQRISQIEGVAEVRTNGADKPAVRVQIDPTRLAAANMGMEDVRTALAQANVDAPKGMFNGTQRSLAIGANDQINGAANYAPLVIRSGAGTTLRLRDVANVIDGVENDKQAGWYNKGKAVLVIIFKQADANVIETVDRIKAVMPTLESWMPPGSKVSVLADRTQTIRSSVDDVELTLLASATLVVLVVFFALGRVTPTLAAVVTVPLSLAGTFAAMWALGYSLDNISLMALTISVGFVVDDAIVMIENISRHVEGGQKPLKAAVDGAREITFTVISISISLVAVFIPLLFMGGIIGRLFREFAVTLTVAIAVSALISLTVTPSFFAHLMHWRRRHGQGGSHESHVGERLFDWLQGHYERGLGWVLRHQRFMLGVMLSTIGFTVLLYIYAPKGFLPSVDTGFLMANTIARSDISFAALSKHQQEAAKIILDDPAVEGLGSFIGGGNALATTNSGRMYITLKPLSERDANADQVIARLRPKLAKIEGLSTTLQNPLAVPVGGRSSKAAYQFALWDESLEELTEWTPRLIERLKREPGITDLSSDQDAAALQVNVVVDRDRASQLGVDMQAVDQVLQDSLAQRQVSTIYTQRNEYHVVLELNPDEQQSPQSLDKIYVKSANGQQVRLSEIAHVEMGRAPVSVMHQGQLPASTLTFNLPTGSSLGDAAKQIEKASADIHLPPTLRSGFAGSAKAFADSLSSQPLLILSALIAIYIVLGVLYENTLHPITILSTLPSAGIGALLALRLFNYDLSLISIIGVILLMGIVKKNGIILVDFAIVAERGGASAEAAIREACSRRFRPILMTTLAALFGALPLILAGGNGSELRRPLGVAIAGGLIVSQMLTLYTTPVVYLAMARLSRWRRQAWRKQPA